MDSGPLTPAIILVQPQEEGNIGAVARAMANMGLDELVLVDPQAPIGTTARAFAVGAGFILGPVVGGLLYDWLGYAAPFIASALMGVLVPYFFRLIKIDPAIAAGPLVTTIDDIIAIGIYYLVALLLISA